MRPSPRCATVAIATVLVLAGLVVCAAAQDERTIYVGKSFSVPLPSGGGSIIVGDPAVANYQVARDYKSVTVFGVSEGRTTFRVVSGKGVAVTSLILVVTTQEKETLAALKELLRDFPSVEARLLAGQLVVTGAVSSRDDFDAIDRVARTVQAKNLVRYVAPTSPDVPGTQTSPTRDELPGTRNPPPPTRDEVSTPPVPRFIEYSIEVIEGSVTFATGSFGSGVEPSGRRLFAGTIRTELNKEGELFVGGDATRSGAAEAPARSGGTAGPPSGLRFKVRSEPAPGRTKLKTFVTVETNLPIRSETYDPQIWRRARFEFDVAPGEPFGLTGGDLLASQDVDNKGQSVVPGATRLGTQVAGDVSGGSSVASYIPIFGSFFGSKSYKMKTTQLIAVIRMQPATAGK